MIGLLFAKSFRKLCFVNKPVLVFIESLKKMDLLNACRARELIVVDVEQKELYAGASGCELLELGQLLAQIFDGPILLPHLDPSVVE